MTILFAADLDGTLIFPPGPEATRPVAPTAAMTPRAAELLIDVRSELTFAAVTTRTPPAVKPLSLPPGPVRLLAASNGARIYINGVEDRDWSHYTYGEVIDAEQLEQAVAVLGAAGLRHAQVRDGAYARAFMQPGSDPSELQELADSLCMTLSLQGAKAHLVPRDLTKAAVTAEFQTRIGASRLLAAGDSRLDLEMMQQADAALRPAHGELHVRVGNSVPTTAARGPSASVEILTWAMAQTRSRVGGAASVAKPRLSP